MKTRQSSTPEKLRGGFYTPPALVDFCLSRVVPSLAPGSRILEPSVGDGAFIRGLADARVGDLVGHVVGLEPFDIEAEKARRTINQSLLSGEVIAQSAISWAASTDDHFDAAIGNPPFVRYQFVAAADKRSAETLAGRLGTSFGGVSNLWIPLLLGALSRLRTGGRFGFVVPTECFTGLSARAARSWLSANTDGLHFDLFPPGSFPGVMQEVAVMSGNRGSGARSLEIVEHSLDGASRRWSHLVSPEATNWTQYLLPPAYLDGLDAALANPKIVPLNTVVRFSVSTVTGANNFFTVDSGTVADFELQDWTRPLLSRLRHAPGLLFDSEDHAVLAATDQRAWLLDFSKSTSPLGRSAPGAYIESGEAAELHERYKCEIRNPWFAVPCVTPGQLLLSKRSHEFPRVVVNQAAVLTTDTIYQGRMVDPNLCSAGAFAAGFHNSLTMLTAELEGRSFGGGVLELVPSEVARLRVPCIPSLVGDLPELDALSRSDSPQALLDRTDELLTAVGLFEPDVIDVLREARSLLLARRLERNRHLAAAPAPTESTEALAA